VSDVRPVAFAEPIAPRFELEDRPAPRLESVGLPAVVDAPPNFGLGTVGLTLAGVGILVFGLAALDAANFVAAQFSRAAVLGWLTLVVAVTGFGLIGAAAWRELHSLFGLRSVDRLRAAFADPARIKSAAREWLASLPEGPSLLPAIEATDDPAAVLALLRAGPVTALRARSDALGRTAALQIFAAAAAVPSPAFDGLLMGWRGARLVRQIAELHGQRPGFFGTIELLRRTAIAAASVMATDLAVNTLSHAVLSSPLLRHVAGDVAGGGVAARRMVVLARATAAACSPVPSA
jgi:putative membrane protein